MTKPNTESHELIEIHIDGSGARLDGQGSGFAWTAPKVGAYAVDWKDGLTNNEAEYSALLGAVEALPTGAAALILTDSELVCEQFNGRYRVRNVALAESLRRIRDVIRDKSLHIQVRWIPRSLNLADKLLKGHSVGRNGFPGTGETRPNV